MDLERSSRIEAAADFIAAARHARTRLDVLPLQCRPRDEDEAYLVQAAVHRRLAPRIGYKIGCTTPVMQQYLGIDHPCAGGLFADGIHASGITLDPTAYVQAGLECEIAVRLGRDLLPADAPFTAQTVSGAVAAYMPAIEIVDDRYVDWRQTDTPTLIADDFFSAGCVLGEPVSCELVPELSSTEGRTCVNGVEAGRGLGADVLGHPHNALAWLANHLAGRATALRAGEVVLTGSLVRTVWLRPGDEVQVTIAGLGSASMRLSAP